MSDVESKTRRMQAKWTPEEIACLSTSVGFDLEQTFYDILQHEIQVEWEQANGMTYEQHDELQVQQLIERAKSFLPPEDLAQVQQRQLEREQGPDSELIRSVRRIIAESGFTRIESV